MSFDGARAVRVDVEHLPDQRYRLWLGEPHPRVDLGVVDRGHHQLGPEATRRVGERLGLRAGSYYVVFTVPRPDHVCDGDRVVVCSDEGRPYTGRVSDWIDGGVFIDPAGDEGGSSCAAEEVTFLDGPGGDPDKLT